MSAVAPTRSPTAGVGLAGTLERRLVERRASGRKLVVPYVTGGYAADWVDVVRAVAAAGADAIEVGLPFSDPMIDGPVIQEASMRALERGTTPAAILESLAPLGRELDVPLIVMTYYNLLAHAGLGAAALALAAAGVAGVIIPDLPLEETAPWDEQASAHGIETVLLAAPTTGDERLQRIAAQTRGFLYAVGVMGVTGERASLATSASVLASRCKAVTDVPVVVGIGVGSAEQAREACEVADGIVVGSALVRRLLAGAGPAGAGEFVEELRRGVDDA